MKRLKKILLIILIAGIALSCVFLAIQTNQGEIWIFGFEEDAEISEVFICKGPDENGQPTEVQDEFTPQQWEEIYLCAFVIPKDQATITVYWIYNSDGRSFASNEMIRIYEPQYLYFSLKEAIENVEFPNYFEEEIQTKKFPTGTYYSLIEQNRRQSIKSYFFLKDIVND